MIPSSRVCANVTIYKNALKWCYKQKESMSSDTLQPLSTARAFGSEVGWKMRELGRRQVLLMGALGLTSIAIADKHTTETRWSNQNTSVKVFETAGVKNGDMWVVLGGLGVQDSTDIMKAMWPSLKTAQYAASVQYADTGLDLDAIPDRINRASHQLGVNAVHFFCHSMSGTMLPDILPKLDRDVRVGMAVYNCTPWTTHHIADEQLVDVINWLPLQGTFLNKFGLQAYDRFFRPQIEDLSWTEKWGVVWNLTTDDASPQTWLDQLAYLGVRQIADYDVLPEYLQSTFMAPGRLPSDNVVLLDKAIQTYDDDIPGIKRTLLLPSEGHANPRQYPTEYRRGLLEAVEEHQMVFSTEWPVPRRHAAQLRAPSDH